MKWKGEILLESLSDTSILDTIDVERIEELSDDDGVWHVYHVALEEHFVGSIGAFLKDGPWFIHFGDGKETIVAFKDAYFKFLDTDNETINEVKEYGRKLQIPEEELNFTVGSL